MCQLLLTKPHGGSGLSDDDFRNTIKCGIREINICTDMCLAVASAAKLGGTHEEIILATTQAVKRVVKEKMRLFGSSGQGGEM